MADRAGNVKPDLPAEMMGEQVAGGLELLSGPRAMQTEQLTNQQGIVVLRGRVQEVASHPAQHITGSVGGVRPPRGCGGRPGSRDRRLDPGMGRDRYEHRRLHVVGPSCSRR